MLCQCDKCGATTRWYDEKCPRCGAALAVEIPTSPIALPRFAPSSTSRDRQNAVVIELEKDDERQDDVIETENVDQRQDDALEAENVDQRQDSPNEAEKDDEPQAPNETENVDEPQDDALEAENVDQRQDSPNEAENVDQRQDSPNETEKDDERQEKATVSERSQRFAAFWRAVDVWRSTFASETASVTIPRGRAARYALGIVFELFVCPPCAIIAAYFFTRALFADRRAQYYAAMQETEKTRRTLAVGLGVFAAFLCAFIFYVQSQEVAVPTEAGPTSRLFNR